MPRRERPSPSEKITHEETAKNRGSVPSQEWQVWSKDRKDVRHLGEGVRWTEGGVRGSLAGAAAAGEAAELVCVVVVGAVNKYPYDPLAGGAEEGGGTIESVDGRLPCTAVRHGSRLR